MGEREEVSGMRERGVSRAREREREDDSGAGEREKSVRGARE